MGSVSGQTLFVSVINPRIQHVHTPITSGEETPAGKGEDAAVAASGGIKGGGRGAEIGSR